MNAGKAIVEFLKAQGVKFIFGYSGGNILRIYDALYDTPEIQDILVRHEQSAAFMANAYSKATGEPGVCMSTVGPGALNLVSGMGISYADCTPVVAITGQADSEFIGRGAREATDQVGLFGPVTKWNTQVTRSDRIIDTFEKAFRIALTGKKGPVHIDIPSNLLNEEIEMKPPVKYEPVNIVEGDSNSIKTAAELLLGAEKPSIIAGGGVIWSGASSEIVKLAEAMTIPVATSFNGRGSIPEDHPLAVGLLGTFGAKSANQSILESDVVLTVGFRFLTYTTRRWTIPKPSTKLIQIDIDPAEIGKSFPVDVGIVGDAKCVLNRMIKLVEKKAKPSLSRAQDIEKMKLEWEAELAPKIRSDAVPIKPQRAAKEIRDFFDRETIITLDVGTNRMFSEILFPIYAPRMVIHGGGWGHLGYGISAAIGAKIGRPKNNVLCIIGDGGFAMGIHELMTAVQYDLPIIVCIFNDYALGMIKLSQQRRYNQRYIGCDLVNPDFGRIMEELGGYGEKVEKPDEIKPALKNALNSGKPAVIDIATDWKELYW